ncbi:MAG: Replication factor C large subunit, partial [Methanoculleus marisnigri]
AKEKKAPAKEKTSGRGRKPEDDDPPGDAGEMRQDLPQGQTTLF